MADNVAITEGSGKSIAGDDIGGVIHQRVKMEYGPNNTATEVSEDNPLPVTGGIVTEKYDYVGITYPNDTTEVFTYKTGGSGGSNVAIVTVVYADSTKEQITSVART